MECNGCVGLKFLSVEGAEDPDVERGAIGRVDEGVILVDHLNEVADGEWDCLDPLELLSASHKLPLKALLVVLEVLLLDSEEFELLLELLELAIEL